MGKCRLEIFKFNPQTDYEFYFQKIHSSYNPQMTLKEMLLKVEGLTFDQRIALRVNGICIFKDVEMRQLVRDFGEKFIIEPLSKAYVSRDLLLDLEAIGAKYQPFFEAHPFITPDHRYKLYEFLHLNTISLQSNPHYLGDGFFKYVRWLLEHYTDYF